MVHPRNEKLHQPTNNNPMNNLSEHFQELIKCYSSSKVHVYDDVLVYFELTEKTAPIVEKELNKLIKEKNLPLIAEQSSPNSAIRKCVFVKEKI